MPVHQQVEVNLANLAIFQFQGQEVRFVDGLPIGIDVAKILGYADPSSAISKIIDTEYKITGVAKIATPGGMQSVTVLREPGIYQLIFSSKLESAKEFQKWVFEEVLPSIRTTGSYSIKAEPTLEESAKLTSHLIDLVFSNVPIKPELVAGLKLNALQAEFPTKANLLEPIRQTLINSTAQEHKLCTATEIGERLGMSAIAVNKLLIEKGYQIKNPRKTSKKDASYVPTDRGLEFADMTLAVGTGKDTTTYQQLRWYESIATVLVG